LGEYAAIGIAVANYFAGNPFYTTYQRFSPADQSNPDGFGIIVVLGIPVAFYLAASANTTRMSGLLKLVNYAYIPAAFVGLVLSGTRTALIGALPGMAFGLAVLTRLRLSARVAALLLLTSAAFILLPYVQELRSFQRLGTTYAELTEGTLNNRINNWREGLVTFTQHPLLGIGGNQYLSQNSLGKLAHNSFLSVLVELGLIGFALFGSILTYAVISAWGQPKWDARFWLTTLLVWAIGASALTYEYRKATWLFLSFVIASAAVTRNRDEMVSPVQRDKSIGQFVP
ncbi:MAG: O-antigen ligase family protein, partial [Nitrososphaerales archaeon]